MDEQISAVFDTYHGMIRQERAQPREASSGDQDGTQDQRLRAVGPQTGRLLNILACGLKAPTVLELGTSFGYSGIWLADAARTTCGRLITMELHAHKSEFAREMAHKAGLADYIDFKVGDAVQMIADVPDGIDFVLVDLWKNLYLPCLEAFYPKLNPGAIVVADNIRAGRADVADYVQAVRAKPDMTSVMLPGGQGVEISRYKDGISHG